MISYANLNNGIGYVNILNSNLIYFILSDVIENILISTDGGEILSEANDTLIMSEVLPTLRIHICQQDSSLLELESGDTIII